MDDVDVVKRIEEIKAEWEQSTYTNKHFFNVIAQNHIKILLTELETAREERKKERTRIERLERAMGEKCCDLQDELEKARTNLTKADKSVYVAPGMVIADLQSRLTSAREAEEWFIKHHEIIQAMIDATDRMIEAKSV